MKKLFSPFLPLLAILLLFANISSAECSFSTPTPSSILSNPGVLWSTYATFHENNNVTRQIEVVQSGGQFTCSNIVVAFDNGVVYPGTDFNLANVNGGDHPFHLEGVIPAGTGCGLTNNILIIVRKKVCPCFGGCCFYTEECSFHIQIKTKANGSVTLVGPTSTCNTSSQNYSVSGSVGTSYQWTSSDPTFKLNGSSNWPITTTTGNVSIQPGTAGTSSTIQVNVTGTAFCGTASSSLTLTSTNTNISLSASPACTEVGNPLTVNCTPVPGATYTWTRKPSTSTIWSAPTNTAVPYLNFPAQSNAIIYNVRCQVSANGCTTKFPATFNLKWCNPGPPGQVSCCFEPEKRPAAETLVEEENLLELYPNPAQENLNIHALEPINALRVLDVSGNVVKHIELVNSTDYVLSLDHLTPGLYMLETTIQGQKIIRRFMVTHQ